MAAYLVRYYKKHTMKHEASRIRLMELADLVKEAGEGNDGNLNEGQISITELNPIDQKQIKQLENILDGKLDTIYSGGSQDGRFVVSIKLSNNYSIYQFTPVVMKNILKFNIKYVTGGYGLVNIAFN